LSLVDISRRFMPSGMGVKPYQIRPGEFDDDIAKALESVKERWASFFIVKPGVLRFNGF
jgi:hypothetical protein